MKNTYKKGMSLMMAFVIIFQSLLGTVYADILTERVDIKETINHQLNSKTVTTGPATVVTPKDDTNTTGPATVVESKTNTGAYTLTSSDVEMWGNKITKFISDTSDTGTDIIIPSHINGVEVKEIGKNVFHTKFTTPVRRIYLTSVVIPDSVTTIGDGAFINNKLTSINIPDSVTTIGNGAFSSNQLTSIEIPDSVTTIGNSVFSNNQLTSIEIPDSVTTIGNSAFYSNQLTSIEIPDNVTTIGHYAFANNQLTSFNIPDSMTTIGKGLFVNNQFTSLNIPDNVTAIGDYAFAENQLTSLDIPDSVTTIGKRAFQYNQLTSLNIPNSVMAIGDYAFYRNQLTSLNIGNSVTTIGDYAFAENQLTTLNIPDSVTAIGDYAFYKNQLTSLNIGNSVTTIGDYAFYRNQLTSLNIGNSVAIIGNYAFAENQLISLNIPDSVTAIDGYAFYRNQLTSLNIGDNVTIIGMSAFSDNQLTNLNIGDNVTIIGTSAFSDNQLTNLNIPDSVTTIDGYAFYRNQLTSLNIPDSVTYIGNGAFENNHLTSLNIPNSLTSIPYNAFRNNRLTSLNIPDSVTYIGGKTFYNNQLTNLNIPDSVTIIGEKAFRNNQLTTLNIPDSVTTIRNEAFYYNEKFTSIEIPDHEIDIKGDIHKIDSDGDIFSTNYLADRCKLFIRGTQSVSGEYLNKYFTRGNFYYDGGKPLLDSDVVNGGTSLYYGTYTVTFRYGGSKTKHVDVKHGAAATPPLPEDLKYKDHVFKNWDKPFTNVQSDLTITAVYGEDSNNNGIEDVECTVRFEDYNGTLLKTETLMEGHNATPPAKPSRKNYIFKEWDKPFTNVQSDLTITAVYDEDSNNNGIKDLAYTIKFKDYNGSVLKTEQVIESNDATPPAKPSRKNYIFKEWDKPFTNVQSDLTITAVYDEDSNNNGIKDLVYTIKFKDYNGSVLKTEQVIESNDATPPAKPSRKNYIFKEWDKPFTNVQSDLTITAVYDEDSNNNGIKDLAYTIKFKDYNGSVLKTEQVIESNDATPPAKPSRKNYIFKEWDKPFTNVQSDLTITAVYDEDSNNNGIKDLVYTIKFKDYNGSVLKTEQVIESNDATPPAKPSRKNYIFKEWDKPFTNVQSDLTITAVYDEDSNNNGIKDLAYTIKFKDYNGSVLKTEQVIESNDATPPVKPSRKNYIFKEWDKPFTNVQSDLTITAVYGKDSNNNGIEDVGYTVTFIDHDGTVLKTQIVIESNDASAPKNPSQTDYIFKGWDTIFTNVQSDLTVNAQYGKDTNNNGVEDVDYTVTFIDHDGMVLKAQTVIESNDASAPATPTRSGYIFTGWDRDFTNIQSNLVVNATFKRDKEAGGSISGGDSVSNNPPNTSTDQSTANSKAYMIGMPDGTFHPEKYLTRAELISLFDRFYTLEDSYKVSASYNVYSDVESDAWYYDAVNRMTQKGLVSGYEDGTFRPDQEVTREELAQVVYNHFELGDCYKREVNSDYFGNYYSDIYGRWSTGALIGLQTRGLLQDFSDASFTPERPISRGETILILNRYFGYDTGYDKDFTTTFSDIESDSEWSLPVALASKDHLINSKFITDLETEIH